MANIFITGGAGFIGSRVVEKFVSHGHKVTVYDTFKQYILPRVTDTPTNLLSRLRHVINEIDVIQGDTLNKDYLRRTLNKVKPDIIIHMASLPLASVAIEHSEDAFNSILKSTVNIMEVMRDFSHRSKLVYISSSMVYGDFEVDSVTEESKTKPKDIYGSLKLAGEVIVNGYHERYGLSSVIIRPTAVYGPYDANQRVLYKFLRNALNNLPIIVHGDGSIPIDFTFVEDTANGILLAALNPKANGEIFNIARGEARSLNNAIEIIRSHFGSLEIKYADVPSHVPKRGSLDITKAKEVLDFKPSYSLEEGIKVYLDHLKNYVI